jgi:putative membrane protein
MTAVSRPDSSRQALVFCTVVALAGLLVSGIHPSDRVTWWLEVAPVLIALPLLIATWRRFPFTWLVYVLIAAHATILVTGGHYTYAHVPLGNWLRDALHLSRNHYDRLGHFAQGFVPALITRELLLRCTPLRRGAWLFTLVVAVCLAVSACYEFIEWWTALIGGGKSEAFLGTQGDPWDTQWDMFLALIGAVIAQLTLSGTQDRALAGLSGAAQPPVLR